MGPRERPMTPTEKKLLRAVRKQELSSAATFVSGRHSTRMALALVRRGVLHAAVSKAAVGAEAYPWQELAVATDPMLLVGYRDKLSHRVKIRPIR